jgi:hypothetical protein
MNGIKAFVAHSFSPSDKELVGIFVDHFQNLAKAYTGFSWDHAVEAEPAPLSEKVLAKIEDKNVFIGICTKSECVIQLSALSSLPFVNCAIVKQAHIQWKTSDWIIQEIGLAVGRKMSVIIFLEDGVRKPGGLFGEIEYIGFSRSNPHASFDKLLQMLVSLTPRETSGPAAEVKSMTSGIKKRRRRKLRMIIGNRSQIGIRKNMIAQLSEQLF